MLRRMFVCATEEASGTDVQRAILDHLTLLLNTRQGGSALDPEYGLPDLCEVAHGLPERLPVLQHALVTAVRRYEPRLTGFVARPCAEEATCLSVRLACRARLLGGDTLAFTAAVSRAGQVALTRSPSFPVHRA